jgi:hypothetical protein
VQVDVFLLSDAATAAADGKLYIHGGGITRINAPTLPITVPVTLAVSLALDADELGRDFHFVWRVVGPDGSPVIPQSEADATAEGRFQGAIEGEQSHLQFTLTMALPISQEGIHRLTLEVDSELVREITLPVVIVPPEPSTAPPPEPSGAP